MTLLPDLFSFAYVPNWYIQLDELAALALPEPWRFRSPAYSTKNPDNPILERYIHSIFKKQVIDYNPEWPIRVNVDHILGDAENFSRLPDSVRDAKNLPLLLETAVELARRWAVVEPSIVVPQGYQGRVQYLLPICLTDMENPDLAMTLTVMDGYYLGNTCLTLEMAYLNARLLARPAAAWLTNLVM